MLARVGQTAPWLRCLPDSGAIRYHRGRGFRMDIDVALLDRLAAENRERYASATPFPHLVIDDFLETGALERVLDEFRARPRATGFVMDDRYQRKWACNRMCDMGPYTRSLLRLLNSQEITNFLEQLTGIEGLVPDPQLAGGGMHELRDAGFLKIHADFNYHESIRLYRRINLILYLNHGWDAAKGGELELWNRSMTACEARYLPLFNRCVIFNTSGTSYHGNPNPVRLSDPAEARRSIALFYYTRERAAGEDGDPHMSVYKYPAGEETLSARARRIGRQCLPPILADAIVALSGRERRLRKRTRRLTDRPHAPGP